MKRMSIKKIKENAMEALYFEASSEVGIRKEYGEEAYEDYKASLCRILGPDLYSEVFIALLRNLKHYNPRKITL